MTARGGAEPTARRLARRAVTVPVALLGGAASPAIAAIGLPLALAVDAARGRGLVVTRALAFGVAFLLCDALGLLAAFAIWLVRGPWTGTPRARWLEANFRLQQRWASAVFGAARRIFRFDVRVEGDAEAGRGPLLLFARHASIVDALLPAVFVSARHGLHLRTVMKRELLVEPCLDVVGHRLPNVFVRRGSDQPEAEVAAVVALGRDLGADEGLLVFPEGTRFTPARRERALARIEASGDAARLARARALRTVLPPRSRGPLALLDAVPDADVVFLAHVGLDGLVSPLDAVSGALVGRRVELRFWRVPRARIPVGREARLAWLDGQWAQLDDWVAAHRAEPGLARAKAS